MNRSVAAFRELIFHRSISTMVMLRLPPPVSFPAISLGQDTSRYRLFLSLVRVAIHTLQARTVKFRSVLVNRLSVGGGRLSCVPVLPLSACDMFSDPGRISPTRRNAGLMLSWHSEQPGLQRAEQFRGSIAYPQQSLSTLRAGISTYYARLASDG